MEDNSKKIWKRFSMLFEGYSKNYGEFRIQKASDSGKMEGKAYTKTGTALEPQWKNHLSGTGPGLGQIPLRDDDTVVFAAIDIDEYNLDFEKLEQDIKTNKFPLALCKSKSGGAHCYLFLKEPTDAGIIRDKLAAWATSLGFGGCEVFPKQSYRANENDIGNWINLPYFDAKDTKRFCIKDGKSLSLVDFIKYAEELKTDVKDVKAVKSKYETVGDDDGWLSGAPPCLCHVAACGGTPEGTRNETMFNFAGYLKKRFPDDWQDRLASYNDRYCNPKLSLNEVNALVKTHSKKDYDLKCTGPNCDRKKCRMAKFGVGETIGSNKRPEIGSITKYEGEPVYWGLEIDGRRVLCDSDTLLNQNKFNKLCMEQINRIPGSMPKPRYEAMIDDLLQNIDVVPVPEDASKKGQFYIYLETFFIGTNRRAKSRDEIKLGKPYREDGSIYFLSTSLIEFLNEKRFKYDNEHLVWQWLREKGADKKQMRFKDGNANVWIMEDTYEAPEEKQKNFLDEEEF